MKWFEGIEEDLDFTRPRVVMEAGRVVLENVAGIVMLSETALTVRHGLLHSVGPMRGLEKVMARGGGTWFTTIGGSDFVMKEIYEGRLLVEGKIQRVEFLQSQSGGQD
jgi:hypothetical protein